MDWGLNDMIKQQAKDDILNCLQSICAGGVSIGAAYTIAAERMGLPRHVVSGVFCEARLAEVDAMDRQRLAVS